MAEHMPEDVIVKIFQRLPTKSLIRFTSISKEWRFIILRDPNFTTSHYQIASHNKTLRHSICYDSYVGSHYCFDSPNSSSSLVVKNLRYPPMKPGSSVRIHSSCRGLVLVQFEKEWHIWNPSTGLFKKLPVLELPNDDFRTFTGFGYVSATRDYKILIATCKLEQRERAMIRIFSSKSNTWRRIQDLIQYASSSLRNAGTLSNEALHWLRMTDNVIVAFDLADEKFRTMQLPFIEDESEDESHEYEGRYKRDLGDFGGCLCVFQTTNDAASMDYWVMREYGVSSSWTKLFNLRISNIPEEIYNVLLILVTETCTFLEVYTMSTKFGGKLVRIYHEQEKIEDIQMDQYGMIGYEESLLWIE